MKLLYYTLRFAVPFAAGATIALYVEWDWAWRFYLLFLSVNMAGYIEGYLRRDYQ
jgi:hypothetical protein